MEYIEEFIETESDVVLIEHALSRLLQAKEHRDYLDLFEKYKRFPLNPEIKDNVKKVQVLADMVSAFDVLKLPYLTLSCPVHLVDNMEDSKRFLVRLLSLLVVVDPCFRNGLLILVFQLWDLMSNVL